MASKDIVTSAPLASATSPKPFAYVPFNVNDTRSPFFIFNSAIAMPSHGALLTSHVTLSSARTTVTPSTDLTSYVTTTSSSALAATNPVGSLSVSFFITPPSPLKSLCDLNDNNSTSKINVAPPGIFGGAPRSPYAYSGLHSNVARSPIFIVATPTSHALIT